MLLVPDCPLKTVVVSIEKGPYVGWIVLEAEGEDEASSARVVTMPPGTCSVGETGAPQGAAPMATGAALAAAQCCGMLHTPDPCPQGAPKASPPWQHPG